jgi:hypothetical protein
VKPNQLGPTDKASPYFCAKIKISLTCVRRRPQNMLERSGGLADWTEHHVQEIQGIQPHVSGRSYGQSTQLRHLSCLDSHYRNRSQKTTTPSSVDYVWKLFFYVSTIQRIFLFIDDFYSDSTLILTIIAMKQCMDIGARPRGCVWSFNVFNVCLNSRRWFVLCLVYISYLVLLLL